MTFTAVPPTDKYRVIHIDDEHEQLFFAKTFLEEADPAIEVISVTNAKDLLEALDDNVDCARTSCPIWMGPRCAGSSRSEQAYPT